MPVSPPPHVQIIKLVSFHCACVGGELRRQGRQADSVNQNSVQRLIDVGDLRPGIMRNQEWHSPFAELHALDFGELVLGLLGCDAVHGEATFGVVDEAEMLASLFDGDDVHEAGGVGCVGADFAVHFD